MVSAPWTSDWNSGKCLFHSLPHREFPEFLVEWKAPPPGLEIPRWYSFPFGTERNSPNHLVNFPVSSLSSAEKNGEIELQVVGAIAFGLKHIAFFWFGWFVDFGKTLSIQRSSPTGSFWQMGSIPPLHLTFFSEIHQFPHFLERFYGLSDYARKIVYYVCGRHPGYNAPIIPD